MEFHASQEERSGIARSIAKALFFLLCLYSFLASIELMSIAFKLAGKSFAASILNTASDPIAGLILGFLTTTLIQSSSSTTAITVGLVASGTLDLRLAIPIVMGANIGTTVTNTIVSIGHVTRRKEFERAFAASTVHDFFNVLAVIVLLPIEIWFHPIEKGAVLLETAFEGTGGIAMISPLKVIVEPVTRGLAGVIPHTIPLLAIALAILFLSLTTMVRIMRGVILSRVEGLFNRVLFRNDLAGFVMGWLLTASVQSSSATTSLVVPLAGTGVLSLRKIFPYTLGANLGTTITAILASFATGSSVAIKVAFSHLVFNLLGIAIFYPLKFVPIWLAQRAGALAAISAKNTALVIAVYIGLHVIPILYIVL